MRPKPQTGRSADSRRVFLGRVAAAGAFSALGFSPMCLAAEQRDAGIVRIRPREYAGAFAHPLKGFRPDISSDANAGEGLDNPLVTLARHYIRWNQIENSAADGVERILEFSNAKWAGVEKRNLKIIPRVYLYWPDRMYWPADLNPGEYGTRKFLDRLGKFIAKLGEAWNRDPRVAYVETGIVGPCGEQWGPTPHFELRKVLGDSYHAAFRNKLCMIRYPWQWLDYQSGVFWDSWGTHKDTARYEVPPTTKHIEGRFTLPRNLRPGRYVLALAILDPAGLTPACRFAIENYFTGGRHPLGRIGVGRKLNNAEMDRENFDDLASDRAVAYRI